MDLAVGFLCDFLSGFLTWRRFAISSWLSQPAVGRLVLLNFIFWPPKIIPWHVFKKFLSSCLGAFRGMSSKIIPWHVLAHSVARLQKSFRGTSWRIPWHVFKNREKNLPGLGLNPGTPPSETDPLTTRPSQRLFWNKKSHRLHKPLFSFLKSNTPPI